MIKVKIDTQQLIDYANKLERLHKSAFPVAVRKSLDELAFVAKKQVLPVVFDQKFQVRKKTFIKAHSAAVKSPNTFDIRKMHSQFGIIKGKSGAGDRLQLQELGGTLSNREKIPTLAVRIGQAANRLVSKKFYYQKYKNKPIGIISKTPRETIVKGKKAVVRFKKGRKPEVLYMTGLNVRIKRRQFLGPAGIVAHRKFPKIFTEIAKKRIARELK